MIDNIKVGDKVRRTIETDVAGSGGVERLFKLNTYTGVVVFVHRKRRFFTAEFDFGEWGKIRESYTA